MSIELTIAGVACNLECPYCYQNDMRNSGNVTSIWNWPAIEKALLEENYEFTVFGGEPLLAPIERLEQVFAFGLERFGRNGIQTNGTLITEQHIELFKAYKVHVGFSTDGPKECSDSRWAGTLEDTRAATRLTHENIELCLSRGLQCSVIVTLWKGNAIGIGFHHLTEWFQRLDQLGMKSARIHLLEVDSPEAEKMNVSNEIILRRMVQLAKLEGTFKNLRFDKFQEYVSLLRQDGKNVSCVWNACDPLTTSAVHGVSTDGTRSNCGRTNKDGVNWLKTDVAGHERQLALYHTPQEFDGCKDCRFFLMCKGECPGTGVDKDWRNRSSHCQVIMGLFEHFENLLLQLGETPVSLSPNLKELEKQALEGYEKRKPYQDHLDTPHIDWHNDHTDTGLRGQVPVRTKS